MQPPDVLQSLESVTALLIQAVEEGRHQELAELLAQRQAELDKVCRQSLGPPVNAQRLNLLEERLAQALGHARESLLADLNAVQTARRAQVAYSRAA